MIPCPACGTVPEYRPGRREGAAPDCACGLFWMGQNYRSDPRRLAARFGPRPECQLWLDEEPDGPTLVGSFRNASGNLMSDVVLPSDAADAMARVITYWVLET